MKLSHDKVRTTVGVHEDLGGDQHVLAVTSWANGEGVDITLHGKATQMMSLSYEELRLLQAVISAHDVGGEE